MSDNYNNIYLFHGSDVRVKEPILNKCKDGKDFGKGFYMSFKFKQANNFSKIIKRRNKSESNIVSEFKLSDLKGLNVYVFEDVNSEWLDCIVHFRSGISNKSKWDKYDVIIGKIADDDTSRTINAYLIGAYGTVGSKKAIDFAIGMLETNRLDNQICFKTEKALNKLSYIGYYKDEP